MWNDVDLNRILLSLGGGGLFCRLLAMSIKWKTFLQTREFFLVKSFPYVKHSCERKKENNRDNPSTFQCTITFSGRRIFSRPYIICDLFHMTKLFKLKLVCNTLYMLFCHQNQILARDFLNLFFLWGPKNF